MLLDRSSFGCSRFTKDEAIIQRNIPSSLCYLGFIESLLHRLFLFFSLKVVQSWCYYLTKWMGIYQPCSYKWCWRRGKSMSMGLCSMNLSTRIILVTLNIEWKREECYASSFQHRNNEVRCHLAFIFIIVLVATILFYIFSSSFGIGLRILLIVANHCKGSDWRYNLIQNETLIYLNR